MRVLLLIIAGILISCSNTLPESKTGKSVYVGETEYGYVLMRNGLPFRIKGAAGSGDHLKTLAEIGGNTIRVYDTTNLKSVLDKALAHNLAVVVDIPLATYESTYFRSQSVRDSTVVKITKLVNTHKDHPALLFWMLGNELGYPSDYFLDQQQQSFISFFNSLINHIHQLDPNHPISTSIASIEKKKIFNLNRKSPDLDFISINIFGQIFNMESEIEKLKMFWKGPFLISEWGQEGPWTNRKTLWNSAIELSDAEKATEIEIIYTSYLDKLPGRNLGDLVFYWGEKQETTHTWFSLLDSAGRKSNMAHRVAKYFPKATVDLKAPPIIEQLMLNKKNSRSNILLEPDSECVAIVEHQPLDSLNFKWEIVAEGWNVIPDRKESKPKTTTLVGNSNVMKFQAPNQAGPYRLFVYIYDNHHNFSTANIPFYILE